MGAIRKTVAMFLVLLAVVIAGVAIADEGAAPPKPEDGGQPAEAQPPAVPPQDAPKLPPPKLTLKATSMGALEISDPKELTYFVTSPDARHYAVRCAGQLIIDGKEAATYAPDSRPIFSPDSQHYAYSGTSPQSSYCVLDGEVTPTDGVVERLFYSPDSKRLAYILRGADNKCCLVVDGEKGKMYDNIKPYSSWQPPMSQPLGKDIFSPDSKRIAYLAQSEGKSIMVLDGNECSESASVPQFDFYRAFFSPDSKHFVYYTSLPGQGGNPIPVLDGVRIEHAWSVRFSADGAHVAYCTRNEEKHTDCIVKDGTPEPEYKLSIMPTFSPDSQHFTYLAGTPQGLMLVVDGVEQQAPNSLPTLMLYSPDSKQLAYVLPQAIILDGVEHKSEHPLYTSVAPVFSPDSNHIACVTMPPMPKEDSWLGGGVARLKGGVALDFVVGTAYNQLGHVGHAEYGDAETLLIFSPDSKHLVYFGKVKNDWFVLVNNKEFIIGAVPYTPPVFDSPTKFHFLALKNGNEVVLFEAEITE